MDTVLALLYVFGLYLAFIAGFLRLRPVIAAQPAGAPRQLPWATLVVALAISVGLLMQLSQPALLGQFERDAGRIAAGEWWRVLTALFFQDGGLAGGVFNVVGLLFVGFVAERLWGSARWLVICFAGAWLAELVALAWQPVGAGNSVANFALAGSVAIVCVLSGPQRAVRLLAGLALVVFVVLLALRDIHGAAAGFGVLIGLAFLWLARRQAPAAGPAHPSHG